MNTYNSVVFQNIVRIQRLKVNEVRPVSVYDGTER